VITSDATTPLKVIDAMIEDARYKAAVKRFITAYDAYRASGEYPGYGPYWDEMEAAREAIDE